LNNNNNEIAVIFKTIKIKNNDYDSYFDIIKNNDSKESLSEFFENVHNNTFSTKDGIYVDKYEGVCWKQNDIKDLLEFLGIKYFEVEKEIS